MKKIFCMLMIFLLSFGIITYAQSENKGFYQFENNLINEITNNEDLIVLSNELSQTNESAKFVKDGFDEGSLKFDKTYGIKIGNVGRTFSVSAMVNISSTADVNAIFFKNMGSKSSEKWVGIKTSKEGYPGVWTHDGVSFRWQEVINYNQSILNSWAYIVYTENNGIATLYINGDLAGMGNVANQDQSELYLGATFWRADAIEALVDNLTISDKVITSEEVLNNYTKMSEKLLNHLEIPKMVISNINLPRSIGNVNITWSSSDEEIIKPSGIVKRPQDKDQIVTLTASMNVLDKVVTKSFDIKVLADIKGGKNDEVILKYLFTKDDGDIIFDHSGNGNHGIGYNKIKVDENGGYFDGVDDYVKMPDGIINGLDDLTIAIKVKPEITKTHQFTYVFGNSTNSGYMFLNTSRPTTNTVRFAITKTNHNNEKDVVSIPGVRANEDANIVVVLKDGNGYLYYNGILAMDSYLGIKPSELGFTTMNYLARSLYSNDAYYKGYIKEFTIYPYAMEKDEVSNLYKKEQDEKVVIEKALSSVSFDQNLFDEGKKVKANVSLNKETIITLALYDEEDNMIDQITNTYESGDHEIEIPILNSDKNLRAILFAYGNDGFVEKIYSIGKGCVISHEVKNEKIHITIINEENKDLTGKIIIASYNEDDSLNKVQIKDTYVEKNATKDLTFGYTDNLKTKVFFWSELDNMTPLAQIQ